MNVIWSAEVLYELDQIERFIAQNNPQRGSEFIETLLQSGDSLAYHPDKGRVVPELSIAAFREILVGHYRESTGHRTDAEKAGWSIIVSDKIEKKDGVNWHYGVSGRL